MSAVLQAVDAVTTHVTGLVVRLGQDPVPADDQVRPGWIALGLMVLMCVATFLLCTPAQNYSLTDFVYYGWFGAVAKAMVGLLHIFYGWVGNYGIAIIMLTVLVRGCMFPVSRGQARSMANMHPLRRELDQLKNRFKADHK